MTGPLDVPGTLAALGFTVLGEVPDVHGISPAAAFKLVVNGAVRPTVRVAEAGAERAWLARAHDTGVVGADGTCHLMISGPGVFGLPWSHVRLPDGPFLTRLQERTGHLDLVAIAASGSPVLGLTEEEWDTWVIEVDPAQDAAEEMKDNPLHH